MTTKEIIQASGLISQPMKFGCNGNNGYDKYTAVIKNEGEDSQSVIGFRTLKETEDYMFQHKAIEKMLVYEYHTKKQDYTYYRLYERSGLKDTMPEYEYEYMTLKK